MSAIKFVLSEKPEDTGSGALFEEENDTLGDTTLYLDEDYWANDLGEPEVIYVTISAEPTDSAA